MTPFTIHLRGQCYVSTVSIHLGAGRVVTSPTLFSLICYAIPRNIIIVAYYVHYSTPFVSVTVFLLAYLISMKVSVAGTTPKYHLIGFFHIIFCCNIITYQLITHIRPVYYYLVYYIK